MDIKKMLSLATFTSGLLMNAPTYSNMAIINGFSSDHRQGTENTVSKVTLSAVNPVRTLSHNLLSFDQPAQSAAEMAQGDLNINTVVDLFSDTTSFAIFEPNKRPTHIKFLLNNASQVSFDSPKKTPHTPKPFAVMPPQITAINYDRSLALKINSAPSWNLKMDSLGSPTDEQATSLTEPALVGLIGFSLIAISLIRRNNKD